MLEITEQNLQKASQILGVSIKKITTGIPGNEMDFIISNRLPIVFVQNITTESIGILGNVTGQNVIAGVSGGNAIMQSGNGMNEQEQELLRLFRSMDMRQKVAALMYLYRETDKKEVSTANG